MDNNWILGKVLTFPAIIIAISFHEFAHAFAAVKLGDDTPIHQGRYTLNPLKHIDPMGLILLLFAGFGWGKPVQVNPLRFKNSSKGMAIVSLAGPVTNFILAFITLIVTFLLETFGVWNLLDANLAGIMRDMIAYLAIYNISLGIFNLIPLPPLDGSKILMHFLPYKARQIFQEKEQFFHIIFILLWISRLSVLIVQPIFNAVLYGMQLVIVSFFGLFM